MPVAAILELFLTTLAQAALGRLMPVLVAKLPSGIVTTIVEKGLATSFIQEKIAQGEKIAADALISEGGKLLASAKAFIEDHVHGELKTAVEAIANDLSAEGAHLHLTADDVRLFASAFAAGKWKEVEGAVEKAVGLAP
jgi:hypothetical protein